MGQVDFDLSSEIPIFVRVGKKKTRIVDALPVLH